MLTDKLDSGEETCCRHYTGSGGESNHGAMDPFIQVSFQPVLYNWYNKGHDMFYLVWDGAYKRTLAANWKK